MTWNFSSWVPLLARLCPSDTYKIWKKGTSVRVDTTLVGLESLRWIRGDVSILFRVDDVEGPVTYLVDHEHQIYQKGGTMADQLPDVLRRLTFRFKIPSLPAKTKGRNRGIKAPRRLFQPPDFHFHRAARARGANKVYQSDVGMVAERGQE